MIYYLEVIKDILFLVFNSNLEELIEILTLWKAQKDGFAITISWSISDFEFQAEQLSGDYWRTVYDETKFKYALNKMIDNHDGNYGITWDEVTYSLNEYCKKDK